MILRKLSFKPAGRALLLLALAGLICLALPGNPRATAGDRSTEYKVKAAYLYNFIKFVKWPSTNLSEEDSSIRIYVLGQDPFGELLEPIAAMKAQNRSLLVVRINHISQYREGHVLFISNSEEKAIPEILQAVSEDKLLTVSDVDGFVGLGGIIGFVIREGRVRLEINLAAARRADIEISAKLLEVATIVESEPHN